MTDSVQTRAVAKAEPRLEKMQGHVLLAQLGKRVLRPGGLELTEAMLAGLGTGTDDDVVEFAPGLGATARLTLGQEPRSYTGIEADADWAARLAGSFAGDPRVAIECGTAVATGLDDAVASVVYGEAMLTMQSDDHKAKIAGEAARLLRRGGRYGIHELCIVPDDVGEETKATIRRDLTKSIHVGARPLTVAEWSDLLAGAGFEVEHVEQAPMHLLEPRRVIRDEGLGRALMIAARAAANPTARQRVIAMRRVFRDHAEHLAAVSMVAVKR